MKVLGVDPGLDGAFASWDGEHLVVVQSPALKARAKGRILDMFVLADAVDMAFSDIDHIFFELIGARPEQSAVTTFKQGTVQGQQQGILVSLRKPFTFASPSMWKKKMGVTAAKQSAVARACELFPTYTALFYGPKGGIKDGVAEAALIAWYGHHQLTVGDVK